VPLWSHLSSTASHFSREGTDKGWKQQTWFKIMSAKLYVFVTTFSSVLRGLDTHSRYALVIYHGPTSLVLAITMWKMQVIKPIAELKNKYWTQQLREKIE